MKIVEEVKIAFLNFYFLNTDFSFTKWNIYMKMYQPSTTFLNVCFLFRHWFHF